MEIVDQFYLLLTVLSLKSAKSNSNLSSFSYIPNRLLAQSVFTIKWIKIILRDSRAVTWGGKK